jgi:S-DNA-T family DNA segregation ATPase FtsK/SpoIIIE
MTVMPETRRYAKTTSGAKKSASKTSAGKPKAQKAPTRGGVGGKKTPARSAFRSTSHPTQKAPRLRFNPLSWIKGQFRRSKPAQSSAGARGKAPSSGLSLDHKLDILGVIMVFVGLPTLLSLFSANRSGATGNWLFLLGQAFGWGVYLFPIGLILVGLWLVLRNFERIPGLSFERLLGLGLFYGNVLAILHFALMPASETDSYSLAEAGLGGGYLGALILEFLRGSLGMGGAAIALLAWLIISLTLMLDVSVADLFKWLPSLVLRLQDAWDEWRSQRREEPKGVLVFPGAKQAAAAGTGSAGSSNSPPGAAGTAPSASFVHSGPPGVEPVWTLPAIEQILEPGQETDYDDESDRHRANIIEETLASFGAPVNVVEINRGPTITQFGVEPDFVENRNGRMRVRVGKIASLADDLALALSARTIRVQAPVPGKGYVGIEVPNEGNNLVALRDVIESDAFRKVKPPLRFALGQDVAGSAVAADLSAMPHLLVAGATGSGKSVCVNSIICCYLLNNTPEDLRIIMVDPKRVELTGYNGIPHLLAPVVVEMERVVAALQWVLREMDNRYHKLAEAGSRNITEYNNLMTSRNSKKMPRLVVIIDELADLMMLAPEETERAITRLAQLARATGIHLILATQRPSVDVVTGLIKANIPARIAFAVASGVDSRVILDQPGAERLLGRGDMLFQAPDSPAPLRLQGVFVSDIEIQRLVAYWQDQAGATPVAAQIASSSSADSLPLGVPLKQIPLWDDGKPDEDKDPLFNEALDLARRQGRASISMLQRRLRIGYTRAARIIESMQEKGLIGDQAGPQGFEILDYGDAAPPIDE